MKGFKQVNILLPTEFPFASDHIKEDIELIEKLTHVPEEKKEKPMHITMIIPEDKFKFIGGVEEIKTE